MNQAEVKIFGKKAEYKYLKDKYNDCVLLIRNGDFYYSFMDDAEEVASVLRTTLLKSGNQTTGLTVSTQFPYQDLGTYLPKLVLAGKRIAICDQNK